jgi:nitroreductase
MEVIYNRRSVRAYTGQPVAKSTVEALIKAATHAPSSMNEQPWAFAVIQNPTQLAACSMGLGTCPIGFARPWLNQARIKRSLSIPDAYVPVFPVVVGYPSGETPPVQRWTPDIFAWQ